MSRSLFAVCLVLGLGAEAFASPLGSGHYLPVRRCRNARPAGDAEAINFTVLMHSDLCQLNPHEPKLKEERFKSRLGNLAFANSILILDHTDGGILPIFGAGIVLKQDWDDAIRDNYLLNACLKLDRISRIVSDTVTDDNGKLRTVTRHQFINLSEAQDVAGHDVKRGRFYPNYESKDAKYEALTCEFVNESLLKETGLGALGTEAIVVPKSPESTPKETKIVPKPPELGLIDEPKTEKSDLVLPPAPLPKKDAKSPPPPPPEPAEEQGAPGPGTGTSKP